jgi:hypothetical protein
LIFGPPGVGLVWAMPRIKKLCEQYDIKGLEVIAVVTENKERVAKIFALNSSLIPRYLAIKNKRIL